MSRECLTRINVSVTQCMNGISGQLSNLTELIQNLLRQASTGEVIQIMERNILCDIISLGSCYYQNTVASNDLHQTAISRSNQPSHYPSIQFRSPCTPKDTFSWMPNCLLEAPGCETKVSSKNFGIGYVKMHGFYGNPLHI